MPKQKRNGVFFTSKLYTKLDILDVVIPDWLEISALTKTDIVYSLLLANHHRVRKDLEELLLTHGFELIDVTLPTDLNHYLKETNKLTKKNLPLAIEIEKLLTRNYHMSVVWSDALLWLSIYGKIVLSRGMHRKVLIVGKSGFIDDTVNRIYHSTVNLTRNSSSPEFGNNMKFVKKELEDLLNMKTVSFYQDLKSMYPCIVITEKPTSKHELLKTIDENYSEVEKLTQDLPNSVLESVSIDTLITGLLCIKALENGSSWSKIHSDFRSFEKKDPEFYSAEGCPTLNEIQKRTHDVRNYLKLFISS